MAVRRRTTPELFSARGTRPLPVWNLPALGLEMFVGATQRNAVAGEFSQIQLWNPSDSGKRVFVLHVHASTGTSTACPVRMAFSDTKLSGTLTVGSTRSDGSSPSAELHSATNASATAGLVGPGGGLHKDTVAGDDAAPLLKLPYEVWEIEPGRGLQVVSVTANLTLQATFRWLELDE